MERRSTQGSRSGFCFPSNFPDYAALFEEMEALTVAYHFSPAEIKALSVRERQNWVRRALQRSLIRKAVS